MLIRSYGSRPVLAIGLIAYANGIPLLLTSKTLTVWLETYGLSYTTIGLFAFLHIPYSIKFLWSPLLDQITIPWLSAHFGQKRSLLIVAQIIAMICLYSMSFLNPIQYPLEFALLGLGATTAAATQHVIMLAWQVEILPSQDWGISEAMGVFGFRLAILTAGAGALRLSEYYSWNEIYQFLAFLMASGLVGVLLSSTKENSPLLKHKTSSFKEWVYLIYKRPLKDFIKQDSWYLILIFMFIARLPDNFFGYLQNLFFLDLGFTKREISDVVKVYGMLTTIIGGFIGGIFIRNFSYKFSLIFSSIAHALSFLFFIIQTYAGHNIPLLYLTISFEHLTGGMVLTVFFSYQLMCASRPFAATHLALMTSIVELSKVIFSSFSGYLIDQLGWAYFLVLVSLSAIPGILLISKLPFSFSAQNLNK